MNMRPRLQLEQFRMDMIVVAGFQSYIRRAVIEDNEDCARYLDEQLADNRASRITALYIAQILYDLRNQSQPVVTTPGIIPALNDPLYGFRSLAWSPEDFQGYHIFRGDRVEFFEVKCRGIPVQVSSQEQASKFRNKLRVKTRNMKTTRTPKVIHLPATSQSTMQPMLFALA